MLTITPAAFAAMTDVEEQRYVTRLSAFLREKVPGLRDEPPAALDAQVRLQIEAARSHGLVSERAVATYALTAAQLGPDFTDHFPGARQILLTPAPGDVKADRLAAFTINLFETLAGG